LGSRKGIRPVKTEWWGAGMVICLERGADLHMAQLMSLPLTVSCFSKIQIGFTFLVLAHPGSPRQRAIKRARVLGYYNHNYKDIKKLKNKNSLSLNKTTFMLYAWISFTEMVSSPLKLFQMSNNLTSTCNISQIQQMRGRRLID